MPADLARQMARLALCAWPGLAAPACLSAASSQTAAKSRSSCFMDRTLARLRSHSCIIDGEAVACDDNGVASFDLIRYQRANESICLRLRPYLAERRRPPA